MYALAQVNILSIKCSIQTSFRLGCQRLILSNFRLSTFYHFIANIDIGEELETIKRKKKFNAETLEATTTDIDDNKQNIIYDPNGNPINLADFQVNHQKDSHVSKMNVPFGSTGPFENSNLGSQIKKDDS